ncbi:hypothetical protein ICN32_03810 [Polynucleobacter wuianus]|uniref:hypothetical protein n=1 Tax=Polynucleobacter wuianus TaxID=1743168 RepID=UPI001C0DA2F6|nr:hypothetical protein [Polynucleobacter wuianus]MBU3609686.1 hypothetical protein [Polynucleobacter wuianus]
MTELFSFDCNGASYQFVSVDALESFVLEHTHIARQLGEAVDKELDLQKRQTFIASLAEVQNLIWKAGDLLNEVESREVKL